MDANRWNHLKALQPPAPRYIHVSAEVAMLPNPRSAVLGVELPRIPWVSKGKTFDRHRNKRKEMNHALAARRRAIT